MKKHARRRVVANGPGTTCMCSNVQIFYPTCAHTHTHTHCMHPVSVCPTVSTLNSSRHIPPPPVPPWPQIYSANPQSNKTKKTIETVASLAVPKTRQSGPCTRFPSHQTRIYREPTHAQPANPSFIRKPPKIPVPALMIRISHPVRLYDALFLAFYARGLGASGSASPSWLKTNRPFEV